MRLGGATRPLDGQATCGDAFSRRNEGPLWTICLADGLGHGPEAAVAGQDGGLLLIWTDGFDPHLDIDQAARRQKGDPEALAHRLIDEFSTRRDDAGVVCCLLEGEEF